MQAGGVEFDLLCLAARPSPDLGRIRELLRRGVESETLEELASQHGLRPKLLQSLSRLAWEAVPAELRQALEAFQHRHLLRTLSVSNELVGVTAGFSTAGIDFATFKGPILGLQLYGDLALREYSDIDIIVPAEQVKRAEEVLIAMGYRNTQGDWTFRQAFLWHQRQYAFDRQGFNASIDLHWDFTADPLPFPLRPSEIWPARASVTLGGRGVPTLAGEELALLLAGHGTKEAWRYLGWVCDFAMLVERMPDLDWSNIHARARRNGSGYSILLASAMAEKLLGTPVPPALTVAPDRSSQRVGRVADRLAARLRDHFPADVRHENLEDLLLCDRRNDKLWAALKIAMTPTPGDYQALPLPPVLWPLYRVSRPAGGTIRQPSFAALIARPLRLTATARRGQCRRRCGRDGHRYAPP